jgi:hypothetical protein
VNQLGARNGLDHSSTVSGKAKIVSVVNALQKLRACYGDPVVNEIKILQYFVNLLRFFLFSNADKGRNGKLGEMMGEVTKFFAG